MKVMVSFLVVVMLLLIRYETASATLFPAEMQVCISGGACSSPELVHQSLGFTAYTYTEGVTPKYLLEYVLGGAANESTDQQTTPLTGVVWLSAQAVYDLTQERHFFTLYLDRVTPTPTNLWIGDSDGLDVGLSLTTADLLNGSGFLYWRDPGGLDGDLRTHGDIVNPAFDDQSFVPCLDTTCEVGAELNLLKLQYLPSGPTAVLVIDPTDWRPVLYSQYRDWDGGGWYLSQSYAVVPEPASVLLLVSGLSILGLLRHRPAPCLLCERGISMPS